MFEETHNNPPCIETKDFIDSLTGGSKKKICEAFNKLIDLNELHLQGRGKWTTCHCPQQSAETSATEKNNQHLTNFETIFISSTFEISACALLDIISRSPRLKAVVFHGKIANHDHTKSFDSRVFLSDLITVFWPWPSVKKHLPVLTAILKKNEKVSTLYSNTEVVCELLPIDCITKLKFLSINLNEKWNCNKNKNKKNYKNVFRLKCLALAKEVEAVELRTWNKPDAPEEADEETETQLTRVYDQYRGDLWLYLAKLPKLKYLAIYGAWEFELVCQQLLRNYLSVELLKINLMPSSLLKEIDDGHDRPILSIADGLKDLRKLTELRSLHYICPEKLYSIDELTANSIKEVVDILWNLDIRVSFTDQVEDLMNNIIRRGNQSGKIYITHLHVEPRDTSYASIIVDQTLKNSLTSPLRERLVKVAESELQERYGKSDFSTIGVWGVEQSGCSRDEQAYSAMKSRWKYYDNKFIFKIRWY